MEQIFCRILISAPECTIRIDAETERKAAEAAEAFLRLCKGRIQSLTVEIECFDGRAGERMLTYLSEVAEELDRV